MTIAFLSNFAGIDPYAVAKALFEALPEFTCGNQHRKDDKVQLCWYGHSFCIPRQAACFFMNWGAYLGNCDASKIDYNQTNTVMTQKNTLEQAEKAGQLIAYPNPFRNAVDLSFRAAQSGRATLRVYDGTGKLVATLFDGTVQKDASAKNNACSRETFRAEFTTASCKRRRALYGKSWYCNGSKSNIPNV